MVLRASRPASRLTAVVEVLCYHSGHSDELEGGQAPRWITFKGSSRATEAHQPSNPSPRHQPLGHFRR
ncbi:hypothetical protein ACFX1R_004269 [Malus domestica]